MCTTGRPGAGGYAAGVRVLVVGSGAREHALCLALTADPEVTGLVCAPGNAGTDTLAESRPLDIGDPTAVAGLAGQTQADLVVIGPEVPLVLGAADAVRAAGIDCFGPSAAAARIEGSKRFAKSVMAAAGVPTAAAETADDRAELATALDRFGPPYVVKDDGLAAGKGVVVTDDPAVARAHGLAVLDGGGRVLVEEHLTGPEVSLFALSDGTTVLPLLPAQDFKRVGDGDTGPNTGGMGAYCPLPWLPEGFVPDVVGRVLRPTVEELAARGTPFVGLLYAGLVLTDTGPRVIEFNARFGDPETQVVLALLRTPLGVLLRAAATGRLASLPPLEWSAGAAVTVVLAAAGYPGAVRGGDRVRGAAAHGVLHAGTRRSPDGDVLTCGGRVLSVVGTGETVEQARAAAYDRVRSVDFDGRHYRTDIAARLPGG